MQNPQEIFDRIDEKKKKIKDIKTVLSDAYARNSEWPGLVEKKKALNEKAKQIKAVVERDYQPELAELDKLKCDIKSDRELLRDIVLNMYIKGEQVELEDSRKQMVLPIFSVAFKKQE